MAESLKEDGRPAQQWYWDDWFSEFGLRLCSLAARGLWIDMLGIMFKAEIRGTLTINGTQVDNKSLAKIVGDTESNINKFITELETNDVFSRLPDGTILSRRMYRESARKEEISRIRSEAGKKGMLSRWGEGDNKDDNKSNNKKITKITASSSTSSSTSTPSSKDICSYEFVILWKSWPKEGRFKKDYCFKKFGALVKAGKLERFKKTTQGYSEYLKHKKERENFDQNVMHLSTWLNNWEGEEETYSGFKYKPGL